MRRPLDLAAGASGTAGAAPADDLWAVLLAADAGDANTLRAALARDPRAATTAAHGTRALHLAVRAGHAEAARLLLEAGADAHDVTARGDALITVARERGHREVARLLEAAGAATPDPGGLEERWRATFTALDLALWTGPFWGVRGDVLEARRLAGDAPDLVIAAALGDTARVEALLAADPSLVDAARPTGKRALSAAVDFGHDALALRLLERGADPNLPEGEMAPRGAALHAAARRGVDALVEALLARGADPDAFIDSAGSATYAAATPALRARLVAAGGRLSPHDLVWLGDDEGVLRAIGSEPDAALNGGGSVFAAVCTLERRDLLELLLAAGAPLPTRVDGCRSYLLEQPDMLARLLEHGLDPDLPDWQGATLLHEACARDRRGRPRPRRIACAELLLDAGATLEARDEDLCSRPLAWAARAGLADVLRLLLARGARAHDGEDPPWAAPLAWAERRGHVVVTALLRAAAD